MVREMTVAAFTIEYATDADALAALFRLRRERITWGGGPKPFQSIEFVEFAP